MKKFIITITATIMLLVVGCSNITNINTDPKRPATVPAPTLFSSAERSFSNFMTNTNVNRNIFRLIDQYWTETTYTDESNYNLVSRAIPDNNWNILYRDVIKDLSNATTIINNDKTIDPKVKKNELACIEILNVYAYSELVNIYGNVPYTQALNVKIPNPKYDDANSIYKNLIKRLNSAIGNLDKNAAGFGTADLIYGNSTKFPNQISEWIKFANSLKLKLGITLADADPTLAQSTVESAAASNNLISSNNDNALVDYKESPPNTNPVWVDLVQSGRHDFVVANTLINSMNALNDPRRQFYFTNPEGLSTYTGGRYGMSNRYSLYTHPSNKLKQPSFPGDLMDYSQVEFYLSEAAARGYSIPGSAEQHYKNGIRASIQYWGGTADSLFNNYYNQTSVNWTTAPGNYKEKIGMQEWYAMYNRGMTEWTNWRRLDYPKLQAPPNAVSVIPNRYTYPIEEENLNKANYEAAAHAIGGDKVSTKLFWDKY